MANRLGRSFFRFSTVNRPTPAPAAGPPPEPVQPDFLPPTTESLPPSRSVKKVASPPPYSPVAKPAKSDRLSDSGKQSHKLPDDITIAGQNIGSVMEITQSGGKREGGQIVKKKDGRGIHSVGHENDEATKDKSSHNYKGDETTSLPSDTFMNTNFQSVNNSLVYGASLSHRDPGLHVAFSKSPAGDGSTKADEKLIKN